MNEKFIIKQTGAIQLTTNLGDDYSFYIPVKIIYKHNLELNIKGIYYHSSEGWKTIDDNDNEVYEYKAIDDSDIDNFDISINNFGNDVLIKVFDDAKKNFN